MVFLTLQVKQLLVKISDELSHDCRINPDLDKYLFIYLFILQVNRSHGLQYEVEVKPTICKNNLMATEYQ
jgi:hypothetical protein